MHSKWLDLATEIAAFHYQSKRYDKYKPPSFGANPWVQDLGDDTSEPFVANASISAYQDDLDSMRFERNSVGTRASIKEEEDRVEGHHVVFTASTKKGDDSTSPPPSPTKQSSFNNTPNERKRHARQRTLTDVQAEMDAIEEDEAEMKRQSINSQLSNVSEEDDYDDDEPNGCIECGEIRDQSSNYSDQISSQKQGARDKVPRKGKRSWLQKVRGKKYQRKVEKQKRQKDSLCVHLENISPDGRDSDHLEIEGLEPIKEAPQQPEKQKMKRRRTRHADELINPATTTSRWFKEVKMIDRKKDSKLRQTRQLAFRDQYDIKSGKPYSLFTANARMHLREGNLDPDKVPPLLFLEECAHLLSLMSAVAFSTLRNDLPEAESPLTVFDPGLPWPLVDPDAYKGKVRKGWTRSSSRWYSVLQFALGRSRNDEARTLYNAARPFRVIGNVSDAEIEKLQEARGPLAKVSLVSVWLLELISREYQAGSTGLVAAPIISRLYQFTSEGMAGYNQARKIAYIPFPFPHAQITTLYLLVIDFFVTPLLMSSFVKNVWLGFVLNLCSVLCFTGLHEVAREIENPFQNIPNDVPLNNYQAQFNEGLMVMFYGYHPDAYWNSKQENNDGTTADSPSNQGMDELSNKSVSEKFSDAKVEAGSNNEQSSSLTQKVTKHESLRSPENTDTVLTRAPEYSDSIQISKEKGRRDEDFKAIENLETKNKNQPPGHNGNGNLFGNTQTDDFLRSLMEGKLKSSSTTDSFRVVSSGSDSLRRLSDEGSGPRSDNVMFRIPKRTQGSNSIG